MDRRTLGSAFLEPLEELILNIKNQLGFYFAGCESARPRYPASCIVGCGCEGYETFCGGLGVAVHVRAGRVDQDEEVGDALWLRQAVSVEEVWHVFGQLRAYEPSGKCLNKVGKCEALAPPSGESTPLSASCGSIVGCPLESSAQPSGSASPRLAYAVILPRATVLNARSMTAGRGESGNPAAIGDVDSNLPVPPHGGSTAGPQEKTSETIPASAASAA